MYGAYVVRTWLWWFLDGTGERYPLYKVRPALLRDSEQGRVVWLVLIVVVHNDAYKQLQHYIDPQEHKEVDIDRHYLHRNSRFSWQLSIVLFKVHSEVSPLLLCASIEHSLTQD